MFENIIQLNENIIKTELKGLVKQSVEETLNQLLDQEADENSPKLVNINVQNGVQAIVRDTTRAICRQHLVTSH